MSTTEVDPLQFHQSFSCPSPCYCGARTLPRQARNTTPRLSRHQKYEAAPEATTWAKWTFLMGRSDIFSSETHGPSGYFIGGWLVAGVLLQKAPTLAPRRAGRVPRRTRPPARGP